MTPTIGSLCSGIGGLELGIEHALGAGTIWQSETDPHASTVLAHHWPDVPNLGDLRDVDWAGVETPDVVCFGFPCQDISSAGRRAGIEGERSALWFDCADAVRVLRPRYLLVENVSALLTRGLDRVLGDLAEMGYVGRWGCLRSSDVGAPHRRERVFVAAVASGEQMGTSGLARRCARSASADPATQGWGAVGDAQCGDRGRTDGEPGQVGEPGGCRSAPADADRERLSLWPEHHGQAEDATEGHHQLHELDPNGRVRWGTYAPAIRRWEAIHGPAPAPRDDRGRLNPELPEWMLGYPAGWVTGLDIPRTAQLRLLGNSVQPGVSELAARLLLLPLMTPAEAVA